MITNGSKIQLIKPMGLFTNVGEVCEVVNVNKDGVITFKFGNGMHMGIMSYDEYKKYFTLFEDKKETKKRKWSKWKKEKYDFIDIFNALHNVVIEYRHNGKQIQMRTVGSFGDNDKKIHVKTSCYKFDKFDLTKGLDIAWARMGLKVNEYYVNKYIDELVD